jgi:predicted nucleic acid-binding protein
VILPDTSVWIAYLRGAGQTGEHLADLIEAQRVVICGPVFAELLAGAAEADRELLGETLGRLPWAETSRAGWREVGTIAARLRASGGPLPLTDLVIAVAAASGGHDLWSLDADFERIATVFDSLELYRPD